MARSASRPFRSRARASTSGSSGTAPSLGSPAARSRVADDSFLAVDREASWGSGHRATAAADGSIFLDARGGDRALRVSWHHDDGLVVLSLWRDNVCAGSFRLTVDEVPELIDVLRAGLDRAYDVAVGQRLPRGA